MSNQQPAKALSAAIMKEVTRYNDGMGLTRRQLVDNILIAVSQHEGRSCSVSAATGDESVAFTAYNQAVEDALAAIRAESQGGGYWAATYINAIARKCSPHRYAASLCGLGHVVCECTHGCDDHLDGYGCQQCDCAEYAATISSPAAQPETTTTPETLYETQDIYEATKEFWGGPEGGQE